MTRTSTTKTTTAPAPSTAAQASLYQTLRSHLAVLRLYDCAEALPSVLDAATTEKLSITATLERLLAIEVTATEARRLASRLRFACLPSPASLEDFDYDAQPGVDRQLMNELGTCRFLETATNVLLIGPPGVGKTHLAVGLARRAAETGYRTYVTTAADWESGWGSGSQPPSTTSPSTPTNANPPTTSNSPSKPPNTSPKKNKPSSSNSSKPCSSNTKHDAGPAN